MLVLDLDRLTTCGPRCGGLIAPHQAHLVVAQVAHRFLRAVVALDELHGVDAALAQVRDDVLGLVLAAHLGQEVRQVRGLLDVVVIDVAVVQGRIRVGVGVLTHGDTGSFRCISRSLLVTFTLRIALPSIVATIATILSFVCWQQHIAPTTS